MPFPVGEANSAVRTVHVRPKEMKEQKRLEKKQKKMAEKGAMLSAFNASQGFELCEVTQARVKLFVIA